MLKLDSDFPFNIDFDSMVVLVRAELRVMKNLKNFINKYEIFLELIVASLTFHFQGTSCP